MFNLEQAMSEWRRQMLTAGIKSPVPLDELESHLRDDIEQQIKSGINAQQTFENAVTRIGQANVLKSEFNKSKGMKRIIMMIVGWFAAIGTLVWLVLWLSLHWNFWDWSATWDRGTWLSFLGILIVIAAIWFLAKASRDRASRAMSLLACILVAGFAVSLFPAEKTTGQGFLARTQPSPFWFREGRVLLLCVPGIIWFCWRRRRLAQSDSTKGSQALHAK
jgi:hypothetical protein